VVVSAPPRHRRAWLPWLIWSFGPALFFYAWFQRVAPSIMIDQLMRDLGMSGAALGNLSAFYFYAYAGLQLPVGLLMDRYGPRRLLTAGAAVCAGGTLMFATAELVAIAYLGRLLVGVGAAFSFVGGLKLATSWLPPRHFALASGLVMMSGMLGGMLGQAPMAAVVEQVGWRPALSASALAGLLLAALTWLVVRDYPPGMRAADSRESLGTVLRTLARVLGNRQNLLLAVVLAAMSAPLLGFAGLWGVAWLMQIHAMSRAEAAGLASLLLLGWAVGSPLAGALSDRLGRRKPPLIAALLLGALSLAAIIYVPAPSAATLGVLFVFAGVCFGTMITGYAIARESNEAAVHGATFGFLNGAVVGSGALFQPLLGALLDLQWDGTLQAGAPVYDAAAFRNAFSALLAFLGIGAVAAIALRESAPRAA
jgi:MFS family permease